MNLHEIPKFPPSDAEYLLMDLDGTLTDSSEGIINALLYALNHMGVRENNCAKLKSFIGPPLYESFKEHYGFTRDQSAIATAFFHVYYNERGWRENKPYDGAVNLLSKWKNEGYKLILATSKPEMFAIRILEHFSMDQYFYLIAGGDANEKNAEKSAIIDNARQRLSLREFKRAVMVGDRKYDVSGAAQHNIPTVGVLHGFGSRKELLAAGAQWIVHDLFELSTLITKS